MIDERHLPLDASSAAEHGRTVPTPAFVDRVMSGIAVSAPPSAARSFVDAARERSIGDGVGALIVAAHLTLRGRVPRPVRAQAFALVLAVAMTAGAGAALAATAAVHVAAPIIGLDDRGDAPMSADDTVRRPSASPSPAPSPTPARAAAPVPTPVLESADSGTTSGGGRRPWSHRAAIAPGDRPGNRDDANVGADDEASPSADDHESEDRDDANGDATDRTGHDGGSGSDDRADDGDGGSEAADGAEDGGSHGDGDVAPTATPESTETPDSTGSPDDDGDGRGDSDSSDAGPSGAPSGD